MWAFTFDSAANSMLRGRRRCSCSYVNGNCVEVARTADDLIAVRYNKNSRDPILCCSPTQWHAFVNDVQVSEFDECETVVRRCVS